jgi:hypothetical protein
VTATPVSPTFSAPLAVRLAVQAACVAGRDYHRAEIIRLGEHAIVRLAGGIIAQVARGMPWGPAAAREVWLAEVLIEAGVPCI